MHKLLFDLQLFSDGGADGSGADAAGASEAGSRGQRSTHDSKSSTAPSMIRKSRT